MNEVTTTINNNSMAGKQRHVEQGNPLCRSMAKSCGFDCKFRVEPAFASELRRVHLVRAGPQSCTSSREGLSCTPTVTRHHTARAEKRRHLAVRMPKPRECTRTSSGACLSRFRLSRRRTTWTDHGASPRARRQYKDSGELSIRGVGARLATHGDPEAQTDAATRVVLLAEERVVVSAARELSIRPAMAKRSGAVG